MHFTISHDGAAGAAGYGPPHRDSQNHHGPGSQYEYSELRRVHPQGGQPSIREDLRKNPIIAAGKAISILTKREKIGQCEIETASAYGAAVAMPQIARSSEWSGTLTSLAIRSYFFLAVNIGLQSFVLSMIGTEQLLMYPFAGQMHLCDFGATIPSCSADPDAPNCMGPGGTTLSYPRLYPFSIWNTRGFIKDSLKSMFPHRAAEIHANVDPGEYGMESYWCRMACVFIFMMAVVDDLRGTIRLAFLLWKVPTEAQSWIRYDPPAWCDKSHAKAVHGWTELDLVKFQVAGMPFMWKTINFIIVFVPKVCLWLALASTGVQYLMETANIVNMVVNAMALTFVLDIDEMVFARLTTKITQHIMSKLERLPLYEMTEEDCETEEQVIARFEEEEYGPKKNLQNFTNHPHEACNNSMSALWFPVAILHKELHYGQAWRVGFKTNALSKQPQLQHDWPYVWFCTSRTS